MIGLVQPVLIVIFVAILIVYLQRFRTRLLDRAIIILFVILGIIMVMLPGLTTLIAERVFGVGRGADLVMYFGLSGLLFTCLILYSKIKDLEQKLTQLVRSTAIEEARISTPNETSRE